MFSDLPSASRFRHLCWLWVEKAHKKLSNHCWYVVYILCTMYMIYVSRYCCSLPFTPPLMFIALLMLLFVTIMSTIMSYVDGRELLESFYFNVVTFSTVGLGDVVPKTYFGKLRWFIAFFCCLWLHTDLLIDITAALRLFLNTVWSDWFKSRKNTTTVWKVKLY